MNPEILLICSMALVTGALRYAGFGVARLLNKHPKAKRGLEASGSCLIISYLSVQASQNSELLLPILITGLISAYSRGLLFALLAGWVFYIGMLPFIVTVR